jgi:hypothetical protein
MHACSIWEVFPRRIDIGGFMEVFEEYQEREMILHPTLSTIRCDLRRMCSISAVSILAHS